MQNDRHRWLSDSATARNSFLAGALPRTPLGELTAQSPLAGLRGSTSKGRGWRVRKAIGDRKKKEGGVRGVEKRRKRKRRKERKLETFPLSIPAYVPAFNTKTDKHSS